MEVNYIFHKGEDIMTKYKTLKNKIFALLLLMVGIAPIIINGDATFLVFAGCFGIPLFFAKENWIE